MNSILEIIDERNLYMYLILFKVYLYTQGKTNTSYHGNMEKEIMDLLGNDYSFDSFRNAKQYLISEGLCENNMASRLTIHGRRHFEEWIEEFIKLDNQSKISLNNQLPEKVSKYLGITKDTISTIKSAKDLFEYFTNY